MAKPIFIIAAYIIALASIAAGAELAPAMGMPANDIETHGCALIVLGLTALCFGVVSMAKGR